MVSLTSFSVSGFRAISTTLELRDLRSAVILYGDNATGKSSVLDALRVLGRLCQTPGRELFGRPWDEAVFYERFNLDANVFNCACGDTIRLEASTSEGLNVAFELRRIFDAGGGWVSVRPLMPVEDVAFLNLALDKVQRVQLDDLEPDAHPLGVEPRRQEASQELAEALADWDAQAARRPSVGMVSSPAIPVPDKLRARFGQAWRSRDLSLRRRVRASVEAFGQLFPALGEGALEPTDNPPRHDADVAWIGPDHPLDLDHLGGGPQSAFGTLAEVGLAQTAIVCLEEPEAFVGERAFTGMRGAVQAALQSGIVSQVWIATHAISLAQAGDSIFILDRQHGVTTASPGGPDALARFAPMVAPPSADSLGRLGVDGSVRLPPRVVSEMGLSPGEFVYVVSDDHGFRLLTSDQMQRLLDGET